MKIYLRTANKDNSVIDKITSTLKKSKHKVSVSIIDEAKKSSATKITSYDLLIIEASATNAQLGYDSSFAIESNVPVIVLYHDETGNRELFPLIALNPQTKLIVRGYKNNELENVIENAVLEIEEFNNNRLTLSLNKQNTEFLDWISRNKKIARADYIRSLIETALKKNTEYRAYLKK